MSLTFTFAGRAHFFAAFKQADQHLVVAVECTLSQLPSTQAMLDTAAQWSMLPPHVAEEMGFRTEPDPDVPRYSTRKGLLHGRIEEVNLAFRAELGTDLLKNAPFYICEQWDGPIVIGWNGCLEYLCFALDPRQYEEFFYFGVMQGQPGEGDQPQPGSVSSRTSSRTRSKRR